MNFSTINRNAGKVLQTAQKQTGKLAVKIGNRIERAITGKTSTRQPQQPHYPQFNAQQYPAPGAPPLRKPLNAQQRPAPGAPAQRPAADKKSDTKDNLVYALFEFLSSI